MASFSTFAQQNPLSPTPQTALQKVGGFISKNITQPIGQAFTGGIDNAVQSAKAIPQDIVTGNGPKAIMDTTGIAGGLGEAAMSPLTPVVNPGGITGKGINAAANAIGSIPAVQKFAQSEVGQATAGTIQTAQNVANFAGGVGLAGGMLDLPSKVSDLVNNHPIFQSGDNVATAQRNLNQGGIDATNAAYTISDAGTDFKNDLGNTFAAAPAKIEAVQPGATMTLSPEQLDMLNQLKNNSKFALPEYLNQKTNPYSPQTTEEVENPGMKLNASQTQDLIHQLNNSTYTDKSSGLGIDQSKVGLTNDIKNTAQQAFGGIKDAQGNSIWDNAYKNYSQGRNALDSMSDIMNLKRNATASDVQAKINTIQKLGSTPTGKVILQNAINEFKNVSGYDLTDPVQTIHQLVDKEIALQNAQKGGFLKQFGRGATNPGRLGGAIARLAVLYPVIRAIKNAVSGK